ncbi:polysaccharide deacetylase family protein [Isoptericola jiangsuensis]|uniref:polysaccharide deacetylase family protein n=1 Tax=Isoptericola jiangsuensis TaxID=548579 RepID=UPI003AAFABAA
MPKPLSLPSCGALALLVLVAAGCTEDTDPESTSESAMPSMTAAADSQVVDVPPVLDHSSVAGVTGVKVEHVEEDEDRRSVTTASIPGEPAMENALADLADTDVEIYEGRLSPGVVNELNVSWAPVLAAGPVLGVVSTTSIYTGGAHSTTTSRAVYANVDEDEAWDGEDLLADPAATVELVQQAAEAAGVESGAPDESAVSSDLRFEPDGALVVVVGQGEAAAESMGELAVRIAPDVSADLLTEQGDVVRDAAMAGEPFEGLPDPPSPSPAPEPSEVPTPTAAEQDPGESVDCDELKCIALTFDDGPGPYTEKLLSELEEKDVKVTFFVVGSNAATRPDLVAAEVDAGHVVGNHSWDHPQLTTLSDEQIEHEVGRTDHAIEKAADVRPTLMRPPYGATDDTVAEILADRGEAQILWNVDTEDWKNRDADITTQRALDGAASGAIILMHDIHPTTVDAVPGIIDQLQEDGYTLVTVPQLLGDPEPGEVYYNR